MHLHKSLYEKSPSCLCDARVDTLDHLTGVTLCTLSYDATSCRRHYYSPWQIFKTCSIIQPCLRHYTFATEPMQKREWNFECCSVCCWIFGHSICAYNVTSMPAVMKAIAVQVAARTSIFVGEIICRLYQLKNSCCKEIFIDSAANSNLGHRLLWRPKFIIIIICNKHKTEQNSLNKYATTFVLYKPRR